MLLLQMTDGESAITPHFSSHPEPTPDPCVLNILQTRPSYLSQYYSDLEFIILSHKIYELLQKDCKIVLATDGGAVPFKGSIGFIVTKEDGTKLMLCYGQPAGHDHLSFRVEIYAFLAAIRLIPS